MNEILLINRLNPKNYTSQKKRIFFLMGGLNLPATEVKLVNLLDKLDTVKKEEIVHKYNGVELFITTQDIPRIIKLLVDNNLSIYSVYEIYNPEL